MNSRNKGQVLVFLAIALTVLLGLAALGIDVGYMYSVRHELQRSADAGALAGASYFRETGYWSSSPGDLQMAVAEARARTFATSDDVITSPLDNTEVFVSFPENFRIRVGTERTINLFFSKLFLGPTKKIRAYAVAEAFAATNNVKCLVPWGIPAPYTDNNANGIFDEGDSFTWVDPNDETAWINYQDDFCKQQNTTVTVWDQDNHVVSGGRQTRDNYLCDGSLQILKLTPGANDDNTTNTRVPGNFYGMDYFNLVESCPGMEPTHGADFYSYMIQNSCECTFKVSEEDILDTAGDPLTSLPGNMVGPTISPVAPNKYYAPPIGDYYIIEDGKEKYLPTDWRDAQSLMNGDPDSIWDYDENHPTSEWYRYDPGGGNPGTKGDWWKSPRIIKLPIYSPDPNYLGGVYTPDKGGKTNFKPLGFVGFWVQDIQYFNNTNGTIVGRFIAVPDEGASTEPGPAGTQILNIRLVE